MDKILCVRFVKNAKIEYVNPGKFTLKIGDSVVIDTDRGLEIGKVVKIIDKNELSIDDMVKVIEGPFNGMFGKIKNIDETTGMLEVALDLFGQETIVEVLFTEIEKA